MKTGKIRYIDKTLGLILFSTCFFVLADIPSIMAQKKMESNRLRIAGLQMNTLKDIQQNKKTIIEGIQKAAKENVSFLATPEGSLSGYNSTFDRNELLAALDEVVDIAKNLNVGLMLGTCYKSIENNQEYCYNQIRVYTPEGDYLGAHSKILRTSPIDYPGTGEMVEYVEGTLRTFEWNGIRFGALICNDLWATPGYTTKSNPYLAMKLRQMGAQVIFHAINSGTNQRYKNFHESSAELWAYSLKIPIVEVNAAKGNDAINAQSGLIGVDGKRPVEVPYSGEQFFICEFEIE